MSAVPGRPGLGTLEREVFAINPITQISSSTGIDTPWVNIGDFGEFDKTGNFGDLFANFAMLLTMKTCPLASPLTFYKIGKFGDLLPISSN